MGYIAKGCISPDQVSLVNEIFTDIELEIIKAKKIIKLFENQRKLGVTGFIDSDFGFIDEPIYKGALSLLSR
jgi:citrate lyase subunit beta/citryl-CoA lyase